MLLTPLAHTAVMSPIEPTPPEAVAVPVTASGGVGSLADITALRACEAAGIDAVIIGRALYTGAIKLREAIAAARL